MDPAQRKFDVILCWNGPVWTLLTSLQIRSTGTTGNPVAKVLPHILMAAAEFERELIRERSMAGLKRYRGQYAAGKVGKEVHRKSGKDLAVGRPKRIFARQRVLELRARGLSYRQIARQMEIGEGTLGRVLAP